jgi:glycosyltransferase involved in cell wall biosynthesis
MTSDLVVFGEDWGRHPSSTQHLVKRLVKSRRVLWVNSVGMRRPRLNARDLGRIAGRLLGTRSVGHAKSASAPVARLPDGMTQLSPMVVPWPGSRAAFAANSILLRRQVSQSMRLRGIERPVLWTSLPTALPVVGKLGERALVYYCGDDFGALVGVDHAPILELERRLVAKADLVLAASEALAAKFPSHKTLHLPHGADIALFANAAPRAADLPDGKVAGFYGSISDWIDVDMLAATADALPDWTIALIGAIETDVSLLRARPNIRFLGPRPHAALAGYSQHWTASLLPFRDTPQIRACNPLKLREYLAAGRPIVTTEFPALRPYRDLVSVAADGADFTNLIRQSADMADRSELRRTRVKGETWEARAADIEAALAQL